MSPKKEVSIIIPVYNEEKTLRSTVSSIKKKMNNSIWDYEIILVDDCSTDESYNIIKDIEDIKVVRHESNQGYGASIKDGVKQSEMEFIMITDADGTYPPQAIPRLLKEAINNDMVVGARIGDKVNIPWIRKPAKFFLNKFTSYLVSYNIPDLNSGLRIIKKSQFEKYIHLLPSGFSLTTTITLAFISDDLQVDYVPINYKARQGSSKIRPVRDTLNFISLILKTVVYFNPLKILLPVGLILMFSSAFIGFFSLFALEQVMEATTIMLFVSGVQILILGLIADLIVTRDKS